MGIIRQGKNYNKTYTIKCPNCERIFRCNEDKIQTESPDWPQYPSTKYVKCPTCGTLVIQEEFNQFRRGETMTIMEAIDNIVVTSAH